MSTLPTFGWKNKAGTSTRSCSCGSWKEHWKKHTGQSWPRVCSVNGCGNAATLGAHIFNPSVTGERIVPTCDSCNKNDGQFSLKNGVRVSDAVAD